MKKIIVSILALFTSLNLWAAELTGSVTFANGLYTYNYELSESDTPISLVLVLVNSLSQQYELAPQSSTSPPGFTFYTFGGSIPYNVNLDATYFGWDILGDGVTAPVSGFSFTTTAAPAAQPLPVTYLLDSPSYNGGTGNLQHYYVGSVIAPDFLIPYSVPEPETYAMLLAGLGLVGALARRKWKVSSLPA